MTCHRHACDENGFCGVEDCPESIQQRPRPPKQYGIYNRAEGRWEYDYWGNVFVFSNRVIANAQANARWHQFSGCARAYKGGHEIIPVMEVIEYTEENYRNIYVDNSLARDTDQ